MKAVVNAASALKGPYRAHRERQRARILTAARGLFDERGIDRVPLAEILTAAGVRASTLYEYFAGKDEIVWALVEQTLRQAAARTQARMDAARGGSGMERITALLGGFAEELDECPEHVRFMAQFDAMYARDWTTERLLALETQISPGWRESLGSLIREGIADESLRPDLDPELTMHAVLNGVIGAQRRLASLGGRVEEEYGRPVKQMFDEALRVMLRGLRAQS